MSARISILRQQGLGIFLFAQLLWAGGCIGDGYLGGGRGEVETQDPAKQDTTTTDPAAALETPKPPVIIVSIPSPDPETAQSTQFIKSVFEEQEYQVLAVIQQQGAALTTFLSAQAFPRQRYLVFINNHGSIEQATIDGQLVQRHALEGGRSAGGAVTKEDVIDPLNAALGIENLIYYLGSCHSGQVVTDYAGQPAPVIIPESRAEIPSYGFTEGFAGGDVMQLFLKMLPRGSTVRAAADTNQDGVIVVREFRDYINSQGLLGIYGGDPFMLSNPGLYKGPVYMAHQIIPTAGSDETVFINNQKSNPSSLDSLVFVTPTEAVSSFESQGFTVQIVDNPTYDENVRLMDEMMNLEPY